MGWPRRCRSGSRRTRSAVIFLCFAADAAIFYSISNCQRGLAGISFGDFLIKRVADALAVDLPRLKIFATLSPVPGFRAWLEREGRSAPGEFGEMLLAFG